MKPFTIKMTDDHRTEIEKAAVRDKATSVNDWAREQLLVAARNSPKR
jgi:hypothetical protein